MWVSGGRGRDADADGGCFCWCRHDDWVELMLAEHGEPVSAGVFIDEIEKLVIHGLLLPWRAGADGLSGAVREVVAHQRARDGAQGLLYGRDLRDDVSAVAVFFDHAVQAADLALDQPQAAQVGGLDLRIDACGLSA